MKIRIEIFKRLIKRVQNKNETCRAKVQGPSPDLQIYWLERQLIFIVFINVLIHVQTMFFFFVVVSEINYQTLKTENKSFINIDKSACRV